MKVVELVCFLEKHCLLIESEIHPADEMINLVIS